MWYFGWILGTAFACTFAILNALWFELQAKSEEEKSSKG